jgi:tetratricopeptide (TPR) repeat protein
MRLPRVILVLLALLAFYGAGRRNQVLLAERRVYQPGQMDPLENASPMVAFTSVALGGFRGIVADALWLRLSRLQEEGRYFELNQLATWISTLEPRIPDVWSFHAWNLSYNVSVLFNTPEERWRWVRAGIELLRNEGIPQNPGSAALHWELGWIFQHKVGQDLDQMHQFYKIYWAAEMQMLLDGPRADYDLFRSVPTDQMALLADPQVADLVRQLRALGFDPLSVRGNRGRETPAGVEPLLSSHPGGAALGLYVNRLVLEKRYGLSLSAMEKIDETYGPLDWRLAETQALYWAWQGRTFAPAGDRLRFDRMIHNCVATAFRRGHLQSVPATGTPVFSPNLDMLDNAVKAYERAMQDTPDEPSIRDSFKFFLSDAVQILYQYNRLDRAREIFARLNRDYPREVASRAFEDYVIAKFVREDMNALTREEAIVLVEGAFFNAYLQLHLGDRARAEGYANYGRQVHARYQRLRCGSKEEKDRVCLSELPEYQRNGLKRLREMIGGEVPVPEQLPGEAVGP